MGTDGPNLRLQRGEAGSPGNRILCGVALEVSSTIYAPPVRARNLTCHMLMNARMYNATVHLLSAWP